MPANSPVEKLRVIEVQAGFVALAAVRLPKQAEMMSLGVGVLTAPLILMW